jgi:hypothetical protein
VHRVGPWGARWPPLRRWCAAASPVEVCGGLWGGGLWPLGRRAAAGAVVRREEGAVARSGKRASQERKREEKEMKGKIVGGRGWGAGPRGCGGEPGRAE